MRSMSLARRLLLGAAFLAAVGLVACAVLVVPSDPEPWLRLASSALLVVMAAAFVAVWTPYLSPARLAARGFDVQKAAVTFAVVGTANVVAGTAALSAGLVIAAVAVFLGAAALLTLAVRMAMGRRGHGERSGDTRRPDQA